MTKYELINTPPMLSVVVQLIRNEINANTSLIQSISIYDRFYQIEGSKTERYNQIAEEYNLSAKTVQRIIIDLNKTAR
ncbi:hypothetical protein AAU57_08870 [Nonlabens sp. YIK11]|nr:hypothetical protein AAU57_08870 [Nonlabens sp. YIK11]